MGERTTVPLFANIRIDSEEKFDLFKVTIADAAGLFEEAHVKVRGRFGTQAVEFARHLSFERFFAYQDIQEGDWVAAALEMLRHIQSRSVFLFFEDHRLVSPPEIFLSVARDFESLELDYLCYSWFRASRLQPRNLLPFRVMETPNVTAIECDTESMALIGRISPGYYLFSLVSMVSVQYLRMILNAENRRFKLHSKVVLALAARLFPYPGYRRVYQTLNRIFGPLGVWACIYDPSSPFNLEQMWFESAALMLTLRVGLSKHELFANFDDDNGAIGESLIKRGLYPFRDGGDVRAEDVSGRAVRKHMELAEGQRVSLEFQSAVERIRRPPVVRVCVLAGQADLTWAEGAASLGPGEVRAVYANKSAALTARSAAAVDLEIFDEVF